MKKLTVKVALVAKAARGADFRDPSVDIVVVRSFSKIRLFSTKNATILICAHSNIFGTNFFHTNNCKCQLFVFSFSVSCMSQDHCHALGKNETPTEGLDRNTMQRMQRRQTTAHPVQSVLRKKDNSVHRIQQPPLVSYSIFERCHELSTKILPEFWAGHRTRDAWCSVAFSWQQPGRL